MWPGLWNTELLPLGVGSNSHRVGPLTAPSSSTTQGPCHPLDWSSVTWKPVQGVKSPKELPDLPCALSPNCIWFSEMGWRQRSDQRTTQTPINKGGKLSLTWPHAALGMSHCSHLQQKSLGRKQLCRTVETQTNPRFLSPVMQEQLHSGTGWGIFGSCRKEREQNLTLC